jgi:threonine dehydratase
MPATTPKIKFNYVKHHGGEWLEIVLIGTTFDDAVSAAIKFRDENNSVFIHAFDNIKVI